MFSPLLFLLLFFPLPPPLALALSSLGFTPTLLSSPLPSHGFVPVFLPPHLEALCKATGRGLVRFSYLLLLIFLFPSLFSGSTISGGCVKWDASCIVNRATRPIPGIIIPPLRVTRWREIELENRLSKFATLFSRNLEGGGQ